MKTKNIFTVSAVVALCAFTRLQTCAHASPPQYSFNILGSLGGSSSTANGINNSGQVVGSSNTDRDRTFHAVLWTQTTIADLGTIGDPIQHSSNAFSISNTGLIAGSAITTDYTVEHVVRWTGTTLNDLTGYNPSYYDLARGINDSGQIAGYRSGGGLNAIYATIWTGTTPVFLVSLGGDASQAYGINNSGQVAGASATAEGLYHAVRWTGTTPEDLGTLGGFFSAANGINASGQVVGQSYISGDAAIHATEWNGTVATDLGTLGGTNSYAYAINASGDVVGMSQIAGDAATSPFLYTGGAMYNLNSLLPQGFGLTNLWVGQGNSINDFGQIAAYGDINGQTVALILTPEPTSLVLLAGSGIFLALRRRR